MAGLEQLGQPVPTTGELRLTLTGVPGSAQDRMEAFGATFVDAESAAAEVDSPAPPPGDDAPGDAAPAAAAADPGAAAIDAEVVSTRLPPDELAEVARRLGSTPHPVVVLAHTGGERAAAELVAAGASGLVGEGNEEALLGLVESDRSPTTLLGSYERRFGDVGTGSGRGRDPQTGLVDRRGFDRRISGLADQDDVPRIASLRIISDRWVPALADPVVTLQRRRLATALEHVAAAVRAELYQSAPNEFLVVGPDLSPNAMEQLGDRLVTIAATFRDRGLPLRLVIGHAGPETSTDVEELVDLSRRALDVAAADGTRPVLGAEQLALGVSVTTELEANLRLVAGVESRTTAGPGHGERVGRIAAELARARGWSPAAVARVQLAGHLHDVGRASLPPEAVDGPEGLSAGALEAWRTFPVLGARALRLTAGPVVADAVHAQRERWDGDGFPEGRRATEIPEAARLLAVAHAIEELAQGEPSTDPAGIARALRERAGSELEPDLAEEAAAAVVPLLQAASRGQT